MLKCQCQRIMVYSLLILYQVNKSLSVLGTRLQANKYIQQFTEIFTEEGRKSVRIRHIVPGQLPRVSFTGGMREMVRFFFNLIVTTNP